MRRLGGHIISGINLFAIRESREPVILPCISGKTTYTMRLMYVRTVSLEVSQGQRDTQQVLNIILKRAMREMGLLQVTRLPKYYNSSKTVSLKHLGVDIMRGYTTELTLREGNPVVNIDFSSKIVHIRSLMDEMLEIRGRFEPGKWIKEAKSALEGQIVISNYGNRRCYHLDEICMDKHPTDTFERGGVQISYVDYFRRQYNKAITDPRQPLIRSHIKNKREERDIFLVPELVSLTGLDDSMRNDFTFMRDIGQYTKPSPQDRLNDSKELASGFNTDKGAIKVFTEFDLQLNPVPMEVNSYNVSGESVNIGGNRTVPISPEGSFPVRDSLMEPVDLQNWVIMATERDQSNAGQFTAAIQQKLGEMRVNFAEPSRQVYDSRTFKSAIQRITSDKSLQIVVILLPRSMRKDYAGIKEVTTTRAVVPTQVVVLPINTKRFMSIIEKVALQIQAKVGAQLWTVRPTTAFGKYLMVVGIDVFHDTVNKRNSILGFCATIHPNLNKYYSTITVHPTGLEIGTAIGNLFTEAINVFSEKAKRYPETVVFFRDGVAESQVKAVRKMEVDSVLSACQRVRVGSEAYNPNIIYTVVVKNTSARLFAPAGSIRGGRGGRGGRGARGGATTAPGEVSNPPLALS